MMDGTNCLADPARSGQGSLVLRALTVHDRLAWDALVQAAPEGCFMQSWTWADFKELEGYQTFRYGLFAATVSGGSPPSTALVGGCIFYFYPNPNPSNLLLAPGGPLLPPGLTPTAMALLTQQAEALARSLGAIALRIEPLWSQKPDGMAAFVRAPVDLLPSETLLVDLRPAEVDRLAAMKPKGRYNLRLSQRRGVKTEFTTDPQAIPRFYDLFWETVRRQDFFGEPYGFFINLCQTLFPAGMAEIGLATWHGKPLAGILVLYWGQRATYLYGGRSDAYPEVMAPYQLHWVAMQRAKARGCTVYDFYGFSRTPDHAYSRFSRFKSQFGGQPVTTIGAHDLVFYDQLANTLITLFRKLAPPS
ncbi:methicillin resistance protein [Leptolyngbya sp. 'hensonii']|uniref:lipid II:glycine glycyltransferase FemX n=1 Tax=Leptolyngbya sp. 'hensonii' TaxID=1922337 RepID=UPI00095016E4|nr:peptidoglycan bridge formation glycyltransferase FemA/FemB family protein [Leptolyngbya sp. 'hensonii']OLP17683.1 methicillin resistance protein [Leptolyngbya sp. 'hensonii']